MKMVLPRHSFLVNLIQGFMYSSVPLLKSAFYFGLNPALQATEPQSAAHKVLCRYIEVPCLKRTAAGSLSIEVE